MNRAFHWSLTSITYVLVFLVLSLYLVFLFDIFSQGYQGISFSFLYLDPANAGREGGIFPIIVSTLLLLFISVAICLPIGLGSAIFISERLKKPRYQFLSNSMIISLDILAAVPSIVFGLFGNAFFSKILGLGFSILSGGLTLACMILPLFIRTSIEALKMVPSHYKAAGFSTGLSSQSVLFKITLPMALPGLVTALTLSMGRALSETAALIFTSGYSDRVPESLFDSGRSLSVHIYDLAMNVPGGDQNAYKTASLLVLLLFIINRVTISLSKKLFQEEN